jgi:hypothetical protein
MPSPMNRMTFFALRGPVSKTFQSSSRAVRHPYLVVAGLRQRHVAQDQRRLILAVLALDERRGLAEELGVVLAVERHRKFRRVDETRELDFEIEPRAGQNVGTINRIDGLGLTR